MYAHSGNTAGVKEPLAVHLQAVAKRAATFAQPFGACAAAYAAGLLHDLGKYADQFQQRLTDSGEPGKDHWTVGAYVALEKYKRNGTAIALAIQGHHVGLPDLQPSFQHYRRELQEQILQTPESLTDPDVNRLLQRWKADCFDFPKLESGGSIHANSIAAAMLDVRGFFSTLVDADFIETEAHFAGDADQPRRYRPEGPQLDVERAFEHVCKCVAAKSASATPPSPIQQARHVLWQSCLDAAAGPPGIYTLTAPTGAGKTLAMLGFALRHAEKHGLRRIVLVMPFLNIIEQTAKIYHGLFSQHAGFAAGSVLEDHSLADRIDSEARSQNGTDSVHENAASDSLRLLAENWDSPIILTSHVKLLESLMAHRPGRCRKLHRLAQSVILFDEVQTLPPHLATATLATLARLADPTGPFRSTVLFATATQPAFDHLDQRVRELNPVGWHPSEIVPASHMQSMFRVGAQRYRVRWRHEVPLSLTELAHELTQHPSPQALCIVNLTRHAAQLASMLRNEQKIEHVLHLSTRLCPRHRRRVLDTVEARLEQKPPLPLRLVATQCVEAGVNIDFPVVYRAIAPLDAIAQAAGRCNRHGRNTTPGEVIVINPHDGDEKSTFPPGYHEAVGATQTFLAALRAEHGNLDTLNILNNPDLLRRYFQIFYDLTGLSTNVRKDEQELIKAIQTGRFAEVDRLYRLIDTRSMNVLVPDDPAEFDLLVEELESNAPRTPNSIRQWIHRARPLTVGLFPLRDDAAGRSVLAPLWFNRRRQQEGAPPDWWYLLSKDKYDTDLLGLQLPEEMQCVI